MGGVHERGSALGGKGAWGGEGEAHVQSVTMQFSFKKISLK